MFARRLDKAVHNFFAQSGALVFWQDCDVADVRAVGSACQGSASPGDRMRLAKIWAKTL